MHLPKQLKKVSNLFSDPKDLSDDPDSNTSLLLGLISLLGLTAAFFFFLKKKPFSKIYKPGPKLDIEIRYDTEKDADTTFLAQNLVKIIRMVLTPIESQVKKEDAKLIFVYGDDSWEMRLKNASVYLKNKVRSLLEAQEW